ncbi:MAG: hypothetical protein CMJ76_09870 [Planctomycetaceae bacterium]|nr:hypothetical protein [Planctomycetaceae bacterium]
MPLLQSQLQFDACINKSLKAFTYCRSNTQTFGLLTMQKISLMTIILLSALGGSTSWGQKNDSVKVLTTHGIAFSQKKVDTPIPNQIHILRIDLSLGKAKPRVALGPDPDGDGPAEVALTDPRKLAADKSVLAFVNTNPWDSFPNAEGKKNRNWFAGQPVDIHGLAGTNGNLRSKMDPSSASVWFDEEGLVHLGHGQQDKPKEATSGFQLILSESKILVSEGGARHPRTAIGTDKEGKTLWLVVVDGRQPGYSEGMNLHELSEVMKQLGCWRATNMDGGGSSVMGALNKNGEMQIINRPSDRFLGFVRIRPLPMVLTIVKSNSPK